MEIQVRNPVALRCQIRELIDVHYGVAENMSFMKQYPEVYHIYFTLKVQSDEVQREQQIEPNSSPLNDGLRGFGSVTLAIR